jgi:hypothetical protein
MKYIYYTVFFNTKRWDMKRVLIILVIFLFTAAFATAQETQSGESIEPGAAESEQVTPNTQEKPMEPAEKPAEQNVEKKAAAKTKSTKEYIADLSGDDENAIIDAAD